MTMNRRDFLNKSPKLDKLSHFKNNVSLMETNFRLN